MKVSTLRKYTDALARFATTRDNAVGSTSLVGIQVNDNGLKLISGTSQAGMVVFLESDEFSTDVKGKFSYTIPAKPLLQAAKALPARTDVELRVDNDGLHIISEGGGRMDIGKVGSLRDSGFPKKPKDYTAQGHIPAVGWKQLAKLMKQVSEKIEVPSVQIIDNIGYATVVSPGKGRYISYQFEARGPSEYNMSGYRDFWNALSHMGDEGMLRWGRQGIVATAGRFECFSAPYLVSRWDEETRTAEPPTETHAWPILSISGDTEVGFTIPKAELLTAVKAQSAFDELHRITLQVDSDSLRVSPFGSDDGYQLPCEVRGKGIRSVSADYLSGLLSSMDTKEITLGWSSGQPAITITAKDYSNWTILLAPLVF